MRLIAVAGESLVDIVHDGATREIPGGSPANVALGLARLGTPVEFATWLGDDAHGLRIADHLQASGVRLVPGVFGATRTSVAIVRLAQDGQPTYEFGIEWDLPEVQQTPRWLHVGSIGAFLQPGASKVLALVRRTAAAAGTVSFDPNIRPALLGDAAGVRAWFEQLAASANVVKLSDEDAAWLYPGFSTDAVLDRLLEVGVELAVITTGAAGSVLATALERVPVPSERVDVVDTVGAGDTYMATLIWQLRSHRAALGSIDGSALAELGRVSARAAAITVSRRGADLPTADDLLSVAGEDSG
ncbi:fructokinase [Curtobacterium pusillum]|uniref:Fructokinase n=1 Tax=Curtobacterium pusillum TaxID=69373 RepID=A0AAW3T8H8_9MICO|nr:fructokinase [Curtobacterium pusillum]